jgi:hypothetical protein
VAWHLGSLALVSIVASVASIYGQGSQEAWGGTGLQQATAVSVDAHGNAWVVGFTDAANFPTLNAAFAYGGGVDAFIVELSPSGDVLLSTYLGGAGDDRAAAVGMDAAGNVYVTGTTTSTSFDGVPLSGYVADSDGFIVKLDPTAQTILYAVAVGGNLNDLIHAMAVRSDGTVFVAGETYSSNLPVTSAVQPTLLGSDNAFVAELNPTGGIVYCTYIGGSASDAAWGIAVDSEGSAWVVGSTTSTNFPRASALQSQLAGSQDSFVVRLAANGASFLFSTYFGGSGGGEGLPEYAASVALDSSGNAFVAGVTSSTDFPVLNAWQAQFAGWNSDAFLSSFAPAGTLRFSTYLGGSDFDLASSVAILADGSIFLGGYTLSSDFPVTDMATPWHSGGYNGFATLFDSLAINLLYSTYVNQGTSDSIFAVAGGLSPVAVGITTPQNAPGMTLATASKLAIAVSIAQFNDVSPTATYFDAANLMFNAGVTTGCVPSGDPSTRSYCPNDNVTRDEMAAFIVRAVTGTVTPAIYNPTPYFQDVPPSEQFFPHIQKLMDLGITTGCSQDPPLYCPSETIPRWEMAMFMVRARLMLHGASFNTSTTPYFADVPTNVEGNGMPFPFIQRAYEEAVTSGCATDPLVFCPDDLVTRGEMASFIMRGLFNETMVIGPTAPYLTAVTPNTVSQTAGSQITVTITGANTNFQSSDTVTVPSGMLAVSNVVVNSATSMSATLTVNPNAVAGPQALVVTTGGQSLTLPLAIKVGPY